MRVRSAARRTNCGMRREMKPNESFVLLESELYYGEESLKDGILLDPRIFKIATMELEFGSQYPLRRVRLLRYLKGRTGEFK